MLQVTGVAKAYGSTRALTEVSFSAVEGEVLAVLGENGAGKSTLLKVLAGSVRSDRGTTTLDGTVIDARNPREALRSGIVLVPQELAYVPHLNVAENIMLGAAKTRAGVVSQKALRDAARPFALQLGIEQLLASRMSDLSLAEAQLVEIAKALARNAKVLLLDEPTAALSGAETERLFATIADLRARGIVMVYISHRLDEVIQHCDRVLVLRDGRAVLNANVKDTSKEELIEAMLGAALNAGADRRRSMVQPALGLRAVDVAPDSRSASISFDVARGEILGFYGVRGAGHEGLIEALAGARPLASGHLEINDHRLSGFANVRQAQRYGVSFVPADRKKHGLVLGASVSQNLALPQLSALSRWGWMSRAKTQSLLQSAALTMRLRYRSGRQPVRELSGGNQQKVLIGSRLAVDPKVMVVHEPTRGVDVGARLEIHKRLIDLADGGAAVLVATTDIEEAVDLCDRLIIVRDGRAVAELSAQTKTQESALRHAVGDVAGGRKINVND